MARTLITFIGRGRKTGNGYQRTNYIFADNRHYTTPYFGLALLQDLAREAQIDHFVVLGTAASIWDGLLGDELDDNELWLELGEKVEAEAVDESMLAAAEPVVTEKLAQKNLASRVSLRIIPFGRDTAEQVAILEKLAMLVEPGDILNIDVTHGFRSLPMLGLVSALFLKQIKQITFEGLYYGAWEMQDENGYSPAVELSGLIRIADWLAAISAFKASGDYGYFAPLLQDDSIAGKLSQAGFLERTLNIGQARKLLKSARKSFSVMTGNDSVFGLFAKQLDEFTSWCEEQSFAKRQLAAARNGLRAGDYTRAAALAIEALITSRIARGNDVHNYDNRQQARDNLNENCKGQVGRNEFVDTYMELRDIRNALAHGLAPDRNTFNQQETMKSREKLQERLAFLLVSLEEWIK